MQVSRATISRQLSKAGLVEPEPKKRPKSSYLRFEAAMPNQTWQSDFTHYRLSTGIDVEIITWLDDCTRYALHISAHIRVTATTVVDSFRKTAGQHGIPASTLTDNGMVYTARFSGGRGPAGNTRNALETQLRTWNRAKPASATTASTRHRLGRAKRSRRSALYFATFLPLLLPGAWLTSVRWVRLARTAMTGLGVAMVLYLVWAEFYGVGAICLWCTAVHVITFLLFVSVLFAEAMRTNINTPSAEARRS